MKTGEWKYCVILMAAEAKKETARYTVRWGVDEDEDATEKEIRCTEEFAIGICLALLPDVGNPTEISVTPALPIFDPEDINGVNDAQLGKRMIHPIENHASFTEDAGAEGLAAELARGDPAHVYVHDKYNEKRGAEPAIFVLTPSMLAGFKFCRTMWLETDHTEFTAHEGAKASATGDS